MKNKNIDFLNENNLVGEYIDWIKTKIVWNFKYNPVTPIDSTTVKDFISENLANAINEENYLLAAEIKRIQDIFESN